MFRVLPIQRDSPLRRTVINGCCKFLRKDEYENSKGKLTRGQIQWLLALVRLFRQVCEEGNTGDILDTGGRRGYEELYGGYVEDASLWVWRSVFLELCYS